MRSTIWLLTLALLTACQAPENGTATEAPADSTVTVRLPAAGLEALELSPLVKVPAPAAVPGDPSQLSGWMGNFVSGDWSLQLEVTPEGEVGGMLQYMGKRYWKVRQTETARATSMVVALHEVDPGSEEEAPEWRQVQVTRSPKGNEVVLQDMGLTLTRFEMTFEEAFDTLTYRDGWGVDRKELRLPWNPAFRKSIVWTDAEAGVVRKLMVLGKCAEVGLNGGSAYTLLLAAPDGRYLWAVLTELDGQSAVLRWAGDKEYQPMMHRHDPLRPLLAELKDSLVYQFERSPVGMNVAEHEIQYLCVLEKGQVRLASRNDENGPWEWLTVEPQPETPGVGDHFKVRRTNGERPRELFFNGFMLYAMFDDREAVYRTFYTFQRD